MKQPRQIAFLGLEASAVLQEGARTKTAHLGRFASDIMSCRVMVDLLQAYLVLGAVYWKAATPTK